MYLQRLSHQLRERRWLREHPLHTSSVPHDGATTEGVDHPDTPLGRFLRVGFSPTFGFVGHIGGVTRRKVRLLHLLVIARDSRS